MNCPRTEAAIETCDLHVEESPPDPEIEVILAQHVASVAYAEFEALIRKLIHDRCKRHEDEPLASFTAVAATRLIRRLKIGELSGPLGWVGDAHKTAFKNAVSGLPEAAAAWNNILTGRHSLAHEPLNAAT